MAWSDKLKLNKQLVRLISEAGYLDAKEVQLKTLSRITGGQDVIAAGPEGCGKTTAYILAVLNRLKHTSEGVPHTLVLVPDKASVLAVIGQFERLKSRPLQIVGLYAAPGTEAQMNALADGADVIVATPDRARAIYLKLGLNLNKIDLFIVDDADLIVKQGLQLQVTELANSIIKCQHLVFTTVIHDKLNKMIGPFMKLPAIAEVEEITGAPLATLPQVLYHVPNFGTKVNLLKLFMDDEELFSKTIVFVNTRRTAENIYKNLQNSFKNAVALAPPDEFEAAINDFKASDHIRVLIAVSDNSQPLSRRGIPFLIHFELPVDKEIFIGRVINNTPEADEETLSIIFSTDLELSLMRNIEQAIGKKIPVADLPEELLIEKDKSDVEPAQKQPVKKKITQPLAGEAFHEKKASNSKTYNYSSGTKAKMSKKKKHG